MPRRHSKRSSPRTRYRRYRSDDVENVVENALLQTGIGQVELVQNIDQGIASNMVNNFNNKIVEFKTTVDDLNKKIVELQQSVDALATYWAGR